MFWRIFSFELKYRLGRPAGYIYFSILFLFTFTTVIYGGFSPSEKAYANSAYSMSAIILIMTIFSLLISSAVMGVPIYRDLEHRTHTYLFSYPIKERDYLLGRFLGSFVVLIFICLGTQFGFLFGSALGPYLGLEEAERFGPFSLSAYVIPTLIFTLPNMLFTGAIFFALVALTRQVFATYVGSILLFILYLVANTLTADLEYRNLVDLLDPFALNTFNNTTRYWTPEEQNTLIPGLTGNIFWNRLIWLSVSLLILAFVYLRFSFTDFLAVRSGKKSKLKEDTKQVQPSLVTIPSVNTYFTPQVFFRHMIRLARLEFTNIIRDPYFLAIILGGVLFLFLDGWFGSGLIYGTPSFPLTYYMLEAKNGTYIVFVFIIIIFYTGETVHRDKSVHFNQITDALPIPNWVQYGSKFISLVAICFFLATMVWITGITSQTIQGYFNYEFDKYFTDIYLITFPRYLQLLMLAFIVHVLVNSKFLGHFISIGIWLLMFGIRNIAEVDYNLFFYTYRPPYLISDMNGFGHFMSPLFWYNFYWLCLGGIFIILGAIFWNRGTESSRQSRLALAKQRLNRSNIFGLALLGLLFIGSGGYIYYNTNVLNSYSTAKQNRLRAVDYEKKYQQYALLSQPKVTDIKVWVDLYPYQRAVKGKAKMTLVNKTPDSIKELHLDMNSPLNQSQITSITWNGAKMKIKEDDERLKYRIYELPKAMRPGQTVTLKVEIDARNAGFVNSGFSSGVVYNGSFVNLGIFPSFGYNAQRELTSDKYRKKYDLPEKKYVAPPQDDPNGLRNFLFDDDADYVNFDAIVSTSANQTVIAPGYVQKTWEENGRKYFEYKMDKPMLNFFNISSAEYAVSQDTWKNPSGEDVAIEIYHHPTHTYNLDRLNEGVKAALDYCSKYYSPYQFRQMRILEFPRYANFAQSFPNTVPYAESFGWVGDFSDPDDTDYAFHVTAHEVAHQWWAHQVTPSATRGANQISESMAEYSAFMVLKHQYGEESLQKFLKYSLDRYLGGRAQESKFEATLLDNDTRQYVWYSKGGLVLYTLQDYMGEDTLNKAFANFVKEAAFREKPPFATSGEWYEHIKAVTPDSLMYLVEDCFEKITLYENRTVEAEYTKMENGKYRVTMKVDTKKKYYDGLGKETSQGKKADLIEIGIFAADGKNKQGMTRKTPLYVKKHWLTPGQHNLEFIVDKKPEKAGIDPYNKLIDRVPDDNLISVSES